MTTQWIYKGTKLSQRYTIQFIFYDSSTKNTVAFHSKILFYFSNLTLAKSSSGEIGPFEPVLALRSWH